MNDNRREVTEITGEYALDPKRARLDEILNALAHQRRRHALEILRDCEYATLRDVAARIAARERGCSRGELAPATRERIETELYHVHLPALEDAALVEYDARSRAMRLRDPPDVLDALLDRYGCTE